MTDSEFGRACVALNIGFSNEALSLSEQARNLAVSKEARSLMTDPQIQNQIASLLSRSDLLRDIGRAIDRAQYFFTPPVQK